jgi:hypothetical protein
VAGAVVKIEGVAGARSAIQVEPGREQYEPSSVSVSTSSREKSGYSCRKGRFSSTHFQHPTSTFQLPNTRGSTQRGERSLDSAPRLRWALEGWKSGS